MASEARNAGRAGSRAPGRALAFGAGSRRFALPFEAISGLVERGDPMRVPLAPPFVVGVLDRRGSVLAVLDLACLLGSPAAPHSPLLVRLAPPWDHLALQVAEPVRIVLPGEENGAEDLDVSGLAALAEAALAATRS